MYPDELEENKKSRLPSRKLKESIEDDLIDAFPALAASRTLVRDILAGNYNKNKSDPEFRSRIQKELDSMKNSSAKKSKQGKLPDVTAEEVQTIIDWLKTSPFDKLTHTEKLLYLIDGSNHDRISEGSRKLLRDFENSAPHELLARLNMKISTGDDVSEAIKYLNTLLDQLKGKNESLSGLKESLGAAKYNKIQKLVKECLAEGIEVEITIPKKKLVEAVKELDVIEVENALDGARGKNVLLLYKQPGHGVYNKTMKWLKDHGKTVRVYTAGKVSTSETANNDVLVLDDPVMTSDLMTMYTIYLDAGKQIIYIHHIDGNKLDPAISNKFIEVYVG